MQVSSQKVINWEEVCPEEFRKKIVDILNHPPGAEGSEKFYNTLFPDDVLDIDDQDLSNFKSDIEPDKLKKLHKLYAQAWGKYAEALTMQYLAERGDPISEWDWRPPHGKGEIDIITRRGNRIIFIEVKARCGHVNDPWEAVDDKKIRNLCRGADIYLRLQPYDFEYQFDVEFVSGNYKDYRFEYIEDAFVAPLSKR